MVWGLVQVSFVAEFISCTGIYVVIFPKCLGILHKRDVNGGLMFYLLATMWISFVLITFVRASKDWWK